MIKVQLFVTLAGAAVFVFACYKRAKHEAALEHDERNVWSFRLFMALMATVASGAVLLWEAISR